MLCYVLRTGAAVGFACGFAALPVLAAPQGAAIRAPRTAAVAARGYLKALKSEKGSRICPLVTVPTRQAFIDQARNDGLRVSRCEPAADHDFHDIGRVLGSFHIIKVVVRGRVAYATVNDGRISDSGNDTFRLMKTRGGRWLVDDS